MNKIHRTIKIKWLPKSTKEWKIFDSTRKEAARLWNDLIDYHKHIRDTIPDEFWWPNNYDLQKWCKKKYKNLYSQSVNEICNQFYRSIKSCQTLLDKGYKDTKYPYKKEYYNDVIYSAQQITIGNKYIILINGGRTFKDKIAIGNFKISIPKSIKIQGKPVLVIIKYGEIILTCRIEEPEVDLGQINKTIGIDLGVNTLISATDGIKAINISGREAKSINQYRNKKLASIKSKQSKQTKGSRRHKKLQKRKYKLLSKCKRKIHDICHKATRKVVDEFGSSTNTFVGEPFNDASQTTGRIQAQQISQHCGRILIHQLSYKLKGLTTVINEAYTSQTCPVCGDRNKCKRIYVCKACGFTRPRDVIGSSNIRIKGIFDKFISGCSVPEQKNIKYIHPIKYPDKYQVVPVDLRQVAHLKHTFNENLN